MTDKIERTIRLLPKQMQFLRSTKKFVLYSGGRGCITGNTKLLTKEGEVAIEELVNRRAAPIVLTFTGSDFKWIQAEVPYLKKIEDTLIIKTSDGKVVEVAKDHLFLTTKGWIKAFDCVVGDGILGYSSNLLHSNKGIYQQVHKIDVSHSNQITQDSQYDYPLHRHLYDEQLPEYLNNAQDASPLLDDALLYNHLNSHKDEEVDELVYNHLYQKYNHHAKKDCSYLQNSEYQQQYHSSSKTFLDAPKHSYSKQHHNILQSALEESRPYTYLNTLLYSNAKDTYDYLPPYQQNNNLCLYHDLTHSYNPPLVSSIIQQISHNRHNKRIYDIGVPIYHNYVAEGLIHHNSGKSQALCYAVFREACKPRNEVLLLRKTLSDLKGSTLKSLIGSDGVIPREAIEYHNKSDGIIKIKGGGEIKYRGLDKGTGVRSLNTGCLALDEAIEFTQEEYEELVYGLRGNYGSRQCYMATNPGAPNEDVWLYKKFFLDGRKDTHEVIMSSSYDNHFLPQDFFDSFKDLDETRKKRMVEGLWVAIDGCVFDNFRRTKHVKILPKTDYEEYVLAIDWGQTHLSALILCGVSKGNISVIEEYAKGNLLIDDIKKKVLSYKDKYKNLSIYYDPSAPILYNELGNVGINIYKANNDRNVGIDRIRNRLNNGSLLIDASCVQLIGEFENWVYKPGTEIPVKKGDDCLDALRYVVNSVDDMQGVYIYPQFVDNIVEENDPEVIWQEVDSLDYNSNS